MGLNEDKHVMTIKLSFYCSSSSCVYVDMGGEGWGSASTLAQLKTHRSVQNNKLQPGAKQRHAELGHPRAPPTHDRLMDVSRDGSSDLSRNHFDKQQNNRRSRDSRSCPGGAAVRAL